MYTCIPRAMPMKHMILISFRTFISQKSLFLSNSLNALKNYSQNGTFQCHIQPTILFSRKHLLSQIYFMNVSCNIKNHQKKIVKFLKHIVPMFFIANCFSKSTATRLLTIDIATLLLALSLREIGPIMILPQLYMGLLNFWNFSFLLQIICKTHLIFGVTYKSFWYFLGATTFQNIVVLL